ncbi:MULTISPECIES: hypothetical protein [unclassified Rickettsia]|uniref:hypothetical protein n=1 Tax=unclassified Rickettsia TaxID=114295 RepID=UPI0031331822
MSFPRKRESRKKYKSHLEFISGSTKKDAKNLFSMTRKSLGSRLRGNDTRHFYQATQQRSFAMTGFLC